MTRSAVAVPDSAAPILEVDNIRRTYATAAGPLTVLRDASFSLRAGESLALVGPSGSGKTTLLGLCAGLDQPTSGRVRLAGRELGGLSEDERARVRNESTGFVFQNFQLIPSLTALENVLVPLELRGLRGPAIRDAEERARALLDRVGLGARLGHHPVQLSGGEQQRVALARAFVSEPRILFCDEPTGNLDGATAEVVKELVFGLNREKGATLVLVTHDDELARRCDRVLRLRGGEIVASEANR
ncbi:MAG: ABC transporter ATP-binding protein [Opitutaceae bacterium]|jgi:putative ABC transport system ATP-binding protein|nr:ABC transporter ATP-binding protein [Opitutaceae bacterium]